MDDDLMARIDKERTAQREQQARTDALHREQFTQAMKNIQDFLALMKREGVAPAPIVATWAKSVGWLRSWFTSGPGWKTRHEPTPLRGWMIVRDHSGFYDNPGPGLVLLEEGHVLEGRSVARERTIYVNRETAREIQRDLSGGVPADAGIAKNLHTLSDMRVIEAAAKKCMTIGPSWDA